MKKWGEAQWLGVNANEATSGTEGSDAGAGDAYLGRSEQYNLVTPGVRVHATLSYTEY